MRVLLSWSSGKDCALALYALQQAGHEVVGLLTTVNEAFDRVAMHGVPRDLLEAQGRSLGLPLHVVPLPWPCPNDEYEARMRIAMAEALEAGVTHVAFGDLFLEDVRRYREERLAPSGLQPLFPVWTTRGATPRLAREMLAVGLRARLACVDTRVLPASFAGREYDEHLLGDLPPGVDACGENGEFHTFCYDGPMFARPIAVESTGVVERDDFAYADLRWVR